MSVRYNLPQHILNKYQADKKRVCWKYKEEKYKEDNRYCHGLNSQLKNLCGIFNLVLACNLEQRCNIHLHGNKQ